MLRCIPGMYYYEAFRFNSTQTRHGHVRQAPLCAALGYMFPYDEA